MMNERGGASGRSFWALMSLRPGGGMGLRYTILSLTLLSLSCVTVSIEDREADLRRLQGNPTCAMGKAPGSDPAAALLKAQTALSRKLNARIQTTVRSVARELDGEVSRGMVEDTTISSDFAYAQHFKEVVKYRICDSAGCETAVCLRRRPALLSIRQDVAQAEGDVTVAFRPFELDSITFSNLEASYARLKAAWSAYRHLTALQRVVAGPAGSVDVASAYQRYMVPAMRIRAEFEAMPFLVHVTGEMADPALRQRVVGAVVTDFGRRAFAAQESGSASCGSYRGKRAFHLLVKTREVCSIGFVGPTCALTFTAITTDCRKNQRFPVEPIEVQGLATSMEKARSQAMLNFDLKGRAELLSRVLGRLN